MINKLTYKSNEHLFRNINGRIFGFEKEFLYNVGTKIKIGAEIGSYKGLSSCLVGMGVSKNNGKYYCIDTFEDSNFPNRKGKPYPERTFDIWEKNVKKLNLKNVCIPIIGFSKDVVEQIPHNLDFIFIDGNHDTDSVFEDMSLYWNKLKHNGTMALHDCGWGSVVDGVKMFVQKKNREIFSKKRINGTSILCIEKQICKSSIILVDESMIKEDHGFSSNKYFDKRNKVSIFDQNSIRYK